MSNVIVTLELTDGLDRIPGECKGRTRVESQTKRLTYTSWKKEGILGDRLAYTFFNIRASKEVTSCNKKILAYKAREATIK